MNIEILSIGSEVLEGETINTNAAFLSRQLTQKGYTVARHTVLPDTPALIEEGVKEALQRSKLLIATGGLGPTIDDLTRQSVETLFEGKPHRLANSVGSAPGYLFSSKRGVALLLPGPPREMEEMYKSGVEPYLVEHHPPRSSVKTLQMSLCLLREIAVDPLLRQIQKEHPDAEIGIYPAAASLQLRLRVAKGFERLEEWEKRIRKEFATYLFEADSLQQAVVQALLKEGKTVAFAESCTGGALAARLTAVPDASKVFPGSFVVYSNEWKEQLLGVEHPTLKAHGAVSRETAIEMVQGLFERTDADYALSVTGIAGPTGGSAEKPVGLVYIALGARGHPIDAGKIQAPPQRASVIETTVQTALGVLWRRLAYHLPTFS